MCNRYRAAGAEELKRYFKEYWAIDYQPIGVRYNIAPNQILPIVISDEAEKPVMEMARWNLTPSFEDKPNPNILRTNARSEEVLAKPSYRNGIQKRRCLVPADGFYEWEWLAGGKVKMPWAFELIGKTPFSFAGIWEKGNETRPPSFTILTTTPNELVAKIHDRMPVMLSDTNAQQWLVPGPMTKESLQTYVWPYPQEKMRSYPVNPALNSVRNDTAEAAAPYVAPKSDQGELF